MLPILFSKDVGSHRKGVVAQMGSFAHVRRWEPEMEQAPLSKAHWRKSAQWSSLIRKHAQLVADDVAVADIFAKHCARGQGQAERAGAQVHLRRGGAAMCDTPAWRHVMPV